MSEAFCKKGGIFIFSLPKVTAISFLLELMTGLSETVLSPYYIARGMSDLWAIRCPPSTGTTRGQLAGISTTVHDSGTSLRSIPLSNSSKHELASKSGLSHQ